MKNYKIYAGLRPYREEELEEHYVGTYGFASEWEAWMFAYACAEDIYQSYGGNHGMLDEEAVREDLYESGIIDDDMSEVEIEDLVNAHYREWVDSYTFNFIKEA